MAETSSNSTEWDRVRTAFANSIMVDTRLSSLAQSLDGADWPIKDPDETPAKYIDLGFAEVLEGRWTQLTAPQRRQHVQRIAGQNRLPSR